MKKTIEVELDSWCIGFLPDSVKPYTTFVDWKNIDQLKSVSFKTFQEAVAFIEGEIGEKL